MKGWYRVSGLVMRAWMWDWWEKRIVEGVGGRRPVEMAILCTVDGRGQGME